MTDHDLEQLDEGDGDDPSNPPYPDPPDDPPGPNDRPVLLVSSRVLPDSTTVSVVTGVRIPSWWAVSPLAVAAEVQAHEGAHRTAGWDPVEHGPLTFHVEPSRTTARVGLVVTAGA